MRTDDKTVFPFIHYTEVHVVHMSTLSDVLITMVISLLPQCHFFSKTGRKDNMQTAECLNVQQYENTAKPEPRAVAGYILSLKAYKTVRIVRTNDRVPIRTVVPFVTVFGGAPPLSGRNGLAKPSVSSVQIRAWSSVLSERPKGPKTTQDHCSIQSPGMARPLSA